MKKQLIQIDPNDFPQELHGLLTGTKVYDSSCSSAARVFYAENGAYVKIDDKDELKHEALMAKYFHSQGLGVEVLYYISDEKDYLVTRAAKGHDLTHYLDEPKKLCGVMAEVLRDLHSRKLSNVPVSTRHQRYLDSAEGDYSGGYYDESVLMDKYAVRSKREAWDIMQANKHRLKSDTLIHGDFCLPNVILHDWRFSSLIDFNMSGAGDKHIDIYWALWSLQYNLKTDSYGDYFLDAYGRENFDEDMLKVIAAFELFG